MTFNFWMSMSLVLGCLNGVATWAQSGGPANGCDEICQIVNERWTQETQWIQQGVASEAGVGAVLSNNPIVLAHLKSLGMSYSSFAKEVKLAIQAQPLPTLLIGAPSSGSDPACVVGREGPIVCNQGQLKFESQEPKFTALVFHAYLVNIGVEHEGPGGSPISSLIAR